MNTISSPPPPPAFLRDPDRQELHPAISSQHGLVAGESPHTAPPAGNGAASAARAARAAAGAAFAFRARGRAPGPLDGFFDAGEGVVRCHGG